MYREQRYNKQIRFFVHTFHRYREKVNENRRIERERKRKIERDTQREVNGEIMREIRWGTVWRKRKKRNIRVMLL